MSCFEDDAVKVEKPEDEMIFSEPVDFVENPMSGSTEKVTVGDIPTVLPKEGKFKNNNEVNGVDMDTTNTAAQKDTSAEDTIAVGDIAIVLPEDGNFKSDKEVDLGALHKAEKDTKFEEAESLVDSGSAEKQKSCKEVKMNGDKDKSDEAKKEGKREKKKKDKSNGNDSDDKPKKEKKSKESEGKEDHEKKEKKGKNEKRNDIAKLRRKLEKIDLKMAKILIKKEDYLKRLENALEQKRLEDELACKTQQWENQMQSQLLSMGVSELSSQFSRLTSADKA